MLKEKEFRRIISDTEEFVQKEMEKDGSGHDWWHIWRVRNLAQKITQQEGGNLFLIEMAALLHDIDDWKIAGDSKVSRVEIWLRNLELQTETILKIRRIIDEVSFKGAGVETIPTSLEAQIVQDADRLDAMGAIGVARTFAFGGSRGRLIYDPDIKPEEHTDFEAYKINSGPTINHFYEKLLLLKDRLNTPTAQKMADSRHRFMEIFLDEFFKEWNETRET